MDTPRTNVGDATYLGRQPPDFDLTLEPSFHAPSKDNDLVQQLRNGRAANLRTPRGSRAPFGDRRNLPAGLGGSEFTPMLKSATRNSARKRGKENTNGLTTPALGKINEDMDMTNVPVESSLFGPSRNLSYVDATPLPEADASSTASTPLVLPTRRGGNQGPLQDGNQLSLREQEKVIDKIKNENFGLKLKIHFLEENLRKTGPGFGEAALKENTDLKVDKVTMQRELSKYKKYLASAEKDLETYQQQILDIQQRAKKKYADQAQMEENDALKQRLEDREARIESLQRHLQERETNDDDEAGQLRDRIEDLETDLRARDMEINEHEDEIENLRQQLEQQTQNDGHANRLQSEISDLESSLRAKEDEVGNLRQQLAQRSQDEGFANRLRGEVSDLESSLRAKEDEVDNLRQQLAQRSQNEGYVTQLHGKINNLEADLRAKDQGVKVYQVKISELESNLQETEEKWRTTRAEFEALQQQRHTQDDRQISQLHSKISVLESNLRSRDHGVKEHQIKIARLESDLQEMEEKWKTSQAKVEVLQQQRQSQDDRQINQLRDEISRLEADLRAKDHEAEDREDEIDELNREIEQTKATVREKDHEVGLREDEIDELKAKLEKLATSVRAQVKERQDMIDEWKTKSETAESRLKTIEKRAAESEISSQSREEQAKDTIKSLEGNIRRLQQQLDERNDRLQKAIDVEGALSGKEKQLRDALDSEVERHKSEEALLSLQIETLKRDLEARQAALTSLRGTLDSETERNSSEEATLRRQIEGLRRDLLSQSQDSNALHTETERHKGEEAALRQQINRLERDLASQSQDSNALYTERERHRSEEAALKQQINRLERDFESQQSTLSKLHREISTLQDELLQRELESNEQAEKIEALEDEVEVLQATLDEESEDASKRLREADELCQELRRQLELAKRDQVSRVDRLDQLEEANKVVISLSQQLDTARKDLDTTRKELDYGKANNKELRQTLDRLRKERDTYKTSVAKLEAGCETLDRIRKERDAYRASAAKLEVDCERLKKGAQDALAWIQARNAENLISPRSGPTKTAHIQYGDFQMDIVDKEDHEAVIRAADLAQRRHEKELRGMNLQIEWIKALWERESKLRHDGAFAKKYLQLRLDIADACNKADLRVLNQIHRELGLKSTKELLLQRQKNHKPPNKLKVFVAVIKAVARMRVEAQKWAAHKKTRQRLVAQIEKQKQEACA
ncbi:hypothetical protein F5B22DRAFT_602196 [Xylaria bambusicola]|uniref:uncharacterized protein n=1 Tax=Xylaria bambusicola TaxID=326684 RepID=UPI002007CDE7|nr:uncharacterized protein F5B22DRAFT_602196 [Xylaria bambusicola]KAI0517746.1 hypothetical protein F5B22DRAFT_602196 [Xylaria bambusicola]